VEGSTFLDESAQPPAKAPATAARSNKANEANEANEVLQRCNTQPSKILNAYITENMYSHLLTDIGIGMTWFLVGGLVFENLISQK
jgi:hypothetical protein